MDTLKYAKAETLSIKDTPNSTNAGPRIASAADPSILGLGDLVLKDKERLQPRAGRRLRQTPFVAPAPKTPTIAVGKERPDSSGLQAHRPAPPTRQPTDTIGVLTRVMPNKSRRAIARVVGVILLALPSLAHTQVSCRPNIFGGQDCTGADGRRSTSQPNIFGGYDTTLPDGTRTTSRASIFGGQDITTAEGTIHSRENIFGGQDYQLPNGARIESRSNIFDGEDYRLPDGRTVTCRRNIFSGQDCR